MSSFAALGWFIIQYIEDYQLHSSVGVGTNYPQIWFIPDNENGEKVDYEINPETRPKEFNEIKNNVNRNFKLYHKQLQKLLGLRYKQRRLKGYFRRRSEVINKIRRKINEN